MPFDTLISTLYISHLVILPVISNVQDRDNCEVLRLTKNMKLQKWILNVRYGTIGETNNGEENIEIPGHLLIKETANPIASTVKAVILLLHIGYQCEVDIPMMLLLNIDQSSGLCNGTRLMVIIYVLLLTLLYVKFPHKLRNGHFFSHCKYEHRIQDYHSSLDAHSFKITLPFNLERSLFFHDNQQKPMTISFSTNIYA
ncbi:hypothetical protein V2J09_021533 [Rumex salicifolius]